MTTSHSPLAKKNKYFHGSRPPGLQVYRSLPGDGKRGRGWQIIHKLEKEHMWCDKCQGWQALDGGNPSAWMHLICNLSLQPPRQLFRPECPPLGISSISLFRANKLAAFRPTFQSFPALGKDVHGHPGADNCQWVKSSTSSFKLQKSQWRFSGD